MAQIVSGDERGLCKLLALKNKRILSVCTASAPAAAPAAPAADADADADAPPPPPPPPPPPRCVAALAWVPTSASPASPAAGTHLAALYQCGALEVFDALSAARVHACSGCGEGGLLLAAHRGAFLTVTASGEVRLVPQAAAAAPPQPAFVIPGAPLACAALHGAAGLLAVGGREHDAELWDVATGALVWRARNLPASKLDLRVPVWVTGVAFLREGTPMRAAVDTGEKASKKKKAAAAAAAVAAAAAAAATDGSGAAQQPRIADLALDDGVELGALSPRLLAVATGTRSLRLYDTAASRRPLHSAEGACGEFPLTALLLTQAGKHLVTGDTAGGLKKWALPSLRPLGQYSGHTGAIKALVAHPRLPYMASASLDRSLLVWHVDSRQMLRRLHLKQRLRAALFVPGGGGGSGGGGGGEAGLLTSPEGAVAGAGRSVRTAAHARVQAAGGVRAAGGDSEGEEGEGDEEGEGGEEDVWVELERRRVAAAAEEAAAAAAEAAAAAVGAAAAAKKKRKRAE